MVKDVNFVVAEDGKGKRSIYDLKSIVFSMSENTLSELRIGVNIVVNKSIL